MFGFKRLWLHSLVITLLTATCADASAAGRVLVRNVRVDGAHRMSEDRVRGWLITRAGLPVDSLLIEKDMRRILNGYRDAGYWQVSVAYPEVDADRGRVRFRIEEGRPTLIDSVEISGNRNAATDSLLDAMTSRAGRPLVTKSLNTDLEALVRFYENRGVSLLFAGAGGACSAGQRHRAGPDCGGGGSFCARGYDPIHGQPDHPCRDTL